MTRLALTLAASLVVVPIAASTQTQPPVPMQETRQMPDVTLTGCLVQGTAPNVIVFANAKRNTDDTAEKALKYVVLAGTEDLNLREHLNHEVRILGQAEVKVAPTSPAGQPILEKDLPKLTAKSVTMVSDTCAPAAR
jgi:hypothetical protein